MIKKLLSIKDLFKSSSVTRITSIKQDKYVLIDSMLIIAAHKGSVGNHEMRYELLGCGMYVGMPLLKKATDYLVEHKMFKRTYHGDMMVQKVQLS